jgi:hypothetical protein
MNSAQDKRGGNVPFAFDPAGNASVAVGALPSSTIPQDRLIVGVDFGTTYSGGLDNWTILSGSKTEVI